MTALQNGTQSDSFKGSNLRDQEIKLRHSPKIIDDFIARTITASKFLYGETYHVGD
jgi:hypothetical protein